MSAASCIILLPWAWPLRSILLVLIGLSAMHALRAPRIVGLRLVGRNRLDCLLADGNQAPLAVFPDSTVFLRLIVLRSRVGEEKRVRSLALLPDHMSDEQFRVLRLWLRWFEDQPK